MKIHLVLLIAAIPVCSAQPAIPEFEAASVKPSQPTADGTFFQQMGGDPAIEIYTNVSLRSLIQRAWRLKEYQVIGPEWMESSRYDIRARIPEGAARDQVPAMLQKLLADRFHLAVHRETRELAVYDLVVGKDGVKSSPPTPAFQPKTNRDGSFTVRTGLFSAGVITLTGTLATMESLVDRLSVAAERPVIDQTGLTGSYQFKMMWPNGDGSSLADAVEFNLGLKLVARKAPVGMLVVDHADKAPTAN